MPEGGFEYWTNVVLASFCFLVACCCCYLIGSILKNRKVSSQGYNLYIVLLVIPDTIVNILMGIYNTLSATSSEDTTLLFGVQAASSWFYNFYYVSNVTLNAVVAYEVYTMVHNSYRRRRTAPPSVKRVLLQAATVYLLAVCYATWCIIGVVNPEVKWGLMSMNPETEMAHLGSEVIPTPLAFIIGASLMFGPILYVFYVGIRIRPLLPRTGKTRALSMYFMRIIVVFVLFYIPALVMAPLISKFESLDFLYVIRNALYPMQALVTIFMAYQKDDIKEAMTNSFNASKMKRSPAFTQGSTDMTVMDISGDSDVVGAKEGGSKEFFSDEEVAPDETEEPSSRVSKWEAEDVYTDDNEN